ncbi:MAG: hypothetical protein BWY16_00440 [Candidatus Omnitrophica bacterium ADurb.Bin205]|nr:MAG: hypothetical protein BWY16_00440 [Candidatus Omnitrophica bacterium ADurb.Bin205]
MNKEEAIEGFIKGLRVAFNNALAYPKNHPYLIKSVEEFSLTIQELLHFINPIELDIAPDSLFIDERYWAKFETYVELAKILHQRKIKKIVISPRFTSGELMDLLSALALSPRDIIKNGGLGEILKKSASRNILVEELDYSSLLNSQSQEDAQDVWRYLFKGAVSGQDKTKLNEFADSFSLSLRKMHAQDIAADDDLKGDLVKFMRQLKESNSEKFSKCSKELFNYLVNSEKTLTNQDFQSLKILFNDLNEHDLAQVLWSNVSKDEPPDPLFYSFFSTISEGVGTQNIAVSLSKSIEPKLSLKKDPLLAKRIQGLLLSPDSQNLSPVYRNTLSSMLQDISSSEDFFFNPVELRINYCFILLNMLSKESDLEREKNILERLNKELGFIVESGEYEYIKHLFEVVKRKLQGEVGPITQLTALEDRVAGLIEEAVWNGNSNASLDSLAEGLTKSYKGSQFYLDKIFGEGKVSICGLTMFLKFFPSQLDVFYSQVKSKSSDLDFLISIVRTISKVNLDLSLPILKQIYSFSNEMTKAEILRLMLSIPRFDRDFLLSVLRKEGRILKKEALKVLSRDKDAQKEGVRLLLEIKSPWGSRNRVILENMSIIGELGLKEGADYLLPFTKMNLFWHASLSKRARDILESLTCRKK